jgi:hypothetical protein
VTEHEVNDIEEGVLVEYQRSSGSSGREQRAAAMNTGMVQTAWSGAQQPYAQAHQLARKQFLAPACYVFCDLVVGHTQVSEHVLCSGPLQRPRVSAPLHRSKGIMVGDYTCHALPGLLDRRE